jgi:para-nitrobenzyl esterase
LAEKMITAWTNFAKYSDPNGEGEGLGWKPCTEECPQFMLFKLDDKDAEASEMGEPIMPDPADMPSFGPPAKK